MTTERKSLLDGRDPAAMVASAVGNMVHIRAVERAVPGSILYGGDLEMTGCLTGFSVDRVGNIETMVIAGLVIELRHWFIRDFDRIVNL